MSKLKTNIIKSVSSESGLSLLLVEYVDADKLVKGYATELWDRMPDNGGFVVAKLAEAEGNKEVAELLYDTISQLGGLSIVNLFDIVTKMNEVRDWLMTEAETCFLPELAGELRSKALELGAVLGERRV